MKPTALLLTLLTLPAAAGCGASRKQIRDAERDGVSLRFEMAQVYVDKGAYSAALPLLRRAAAEQPANPAVHVVYGMALRELHMYAQAEQQLRVAIRLAPRAAAPWAELGILYDLMRRPAAAVDAHHHALALAPQTGAYWNNLGFSLYVAGDDAGAVVALEKALAYDPGLLVAHNNLGFAYGRRGEYQRALDSFRAAAGETGAQLNLALVYERKGDLVTAKALRAAAQDTDEAPEEENR